MFHPTSEEFNAHAADTAHPGSVSHAGGATQAEPFFMVPGNRRFYRGEARFPAIRQFWGLALTFVFLMGALAFFIISLGDVITVIQVQKFGFPTTGTVVERHTVSGKSVSYYLTYTFSAPSGTVTGTYRVQQQTNASIYNAHPEGSKVSVLYWKPDPSIAILGDKDSDNSARLMPSVFIGILLVILFIAVAMTVQPVLRDRRYAKNGQIVLGAMSHCDGAMVGGKNRYFKVTLSYYFQSPTGRSLAKVQSESRNDLRKVRLPRPGTPVAVLYLDDQHFTLL